MPFFVSSDVIGGEDEITEAFYVYSHLGCDEQMWDAEGKEVDSFVVKKLLSKYGEFFASQVLGEDLRLTLRVPNPTVEQAEAKVLLETLEGIPRSFDAASLYYGRDVAPIFEVILPMTTSARCIERVYRYYRDFIVKRQELRFSEDDITVAEWIGRFAPEEVQVIPLVEDLENQLAAADIVRAYLGERNPPYQRVFLARSDPAMNYGQIGAVVSNKIALQRLARLEEERGIPIYPIIGAGSAPFRGNLAPANVDRLIAEYPSAQTFTVQSAFKYDYDVPAVQAAIAQMKKHVRSVPTAVDEKALLAILKLYQREYRSQVAELAPLINRTAAYMPRRRLRKLHIGLFGYARSMGGVTLPRAITFTGSLYSIGLPPELLGLTVLGRSEYATIKEAYLHADSDFADALAFLNPDASPLARRIADHAEKLGLQWRTHKHHLEHTKRIVKAMDGSDGGRIAEEVLMAAAHRHFLG